MNGKKELPKAIELLMDSNRGQYLPQGFVNEVDLQKFDGLPSPDSLTILRDGPETDDYWETWIDLIDNTTYQQGGHTWHLYHDGDLFLICDELMTDQEYINFHGRPRDPEPESAPTAHDLWCALQELVSSPAMLGKGHDQQTLTAKDRAWELIEQYRRTQG